MTLYAAMLVLGLASGLHCIGMCGGIVTAFSTRRIAVVRAPGRENPWPRQLAFNGGRLASYALAGSLAGLAGAYGMQSAALVDAQVVLFVLANAMLVLAGLHLAGLAEPLGRLEALGAPLWRRLAPHATRLMGAERAATAFFAGTLWGWLPCGLVYTALATAALAGGMAEGAIAMLAFGLGTLPYLLAAGVGAARLRALFARARWRVAAGMLVLGWGVFGIARAGGLADAIQKQVLCL